MLPDQGRAPVPTLATVHGHTDGSSQRTMKKCAACGTLSDPPRCLTCGATIAGSPARVPDTSADHARCGTIVPARGNDVPPQVPQ